MKVFIASIFVMLLPFHTGCSTGFELPEANIMAKVIDENGKAIDGVNIKIGFAIPKGTSQGIKSAIYHKITDTTGVIFAAHKTIGDVGIEATKDGFYSTYTEYHFRTREKGKWQPWGAEVTLVLRKIENPVPMYARNAHVSPITVPELRKEIGFDLIEFDWVSPNGKGKHVDFIFKLNSTYKSEVDFDSKLELTFPNKFDGIKLVKEDRTVGSALKLPRMAPESGYQDKLIRWRSRLPGKSGEDDQKEENNYIFRIRSEEKNGKLVRAMYGKIHGDIYIHPPTSMYFKYYLNPDYTRNLEFNPQHNLFGNIPRGERIGLD